LVESGWVAPTGQETTHGFGTAWFTDEYKADAVSAVVEGGRSVVEVARNIGSWPGAVIAQTTRASSEETRDEHGTFVDLEA
jgi:hypothetical protein